jgi:hypothetical protein
MISAIVKQEKYRFVRFGCMTLGSILFLAGSVSLQIESGSKENLTAGILNLLGGLLFACSVFMLFKTPDHVGYAKFDQ